MKASDRDLFLVMATAAGDDYPLPIAVRRELSQARRLCAAIRAGRTRYHDPHTRRISFDATSTILGLDASLAEYDATKRKSKNDYQKTQDDVRRPRRAARALAERLGRDAGSS